MKLILFFLFIPIFAYSQFYSGTVNGKEIIVNTANIRYATNVGSGATMVRDNGSSLKVDSTITHIFSNTCDAFIYVNAVLQGNLLINKTHIESISRDTSINGAIVIMKPPYRSIKISNTYDEVLTFFECADTTSGGSSFESQVVISDVTIDMDGYNLVFDNTNLLLLDQNYLSIDIGGSTGNAGDVLTSDGVYATWESPSVDTSWVSQTLLENVSINMSSYDISFNSGGNFTFGGDSLILSIPSKGRLYSPLYSMGTNGSVRFAPYSLPDTMTASQDGYVLTYDHPGQVVLTKPTTLAKLDTTQIGCTIDGQGGGITTGVKGYFRVPFNCTIIGWTIVAASATPISGSIDISCWVDTYANYPPTVADNIFSVNPSLSSAIKNNSDSPSFSGAATLSMGSWIGYNVNSVTSCQKVVLALKVVK